MTMEAKMIGYETVNFFRVRLDLKVQSKRLSIFWLPRSLDARRLLGIIEDHLFGDRTLSWRALKIWSWSDLKLNVTRLIRKENEKTKKHGELYKR